MSPPSPSCCAARAADRPRHENRSRFSSVRWRDGGGTADSLSVRLLFEEEQDLGHPFTTWFYLVLVLGNPSLTSPGEWSVPHPSLFVWSSSGSPSRVLCFRSAPRPTHETAHAPMHSGASSIHETNHMRITVS